MLTKNFSLFCIFILVINVAQIIAQDDDKNFYSKRYDNIDVDTIFRSSRLLNNYVDCLLDKKPCPPEGKDLKRVLPQALRSKCSRCTKIQKAKALDVVTRLYYQHPSIYLSLAERYDPTGEYTRNFEQWYDKNYGNKYNSQVQNNEVPQKSRIPSTWITKPTTTPKTYPSTTSSRPTLRTRPSTIRLKVLTEEITSALPIVPSTTERPIIPTTTSTTTKTTTTTQKTTTYTRLTTTSQAPREQKVQQFDIPANPQFTPATQQVPQSVNFPQPIEPPVPQFVDRQQPVTETISSTFTTTTEVPSIIYTNPATSSFRPPQQATADNVSGGGINTVSAISTSGNVPFIQTPQIPLQIPPVPAVQTQVTSISSIPVPQVPSSFNTQSSVLTSTFGTPLIQNVNPNIPRQPTSQIDPNFIDNFFVPRRGLIRRSVDQILYTTRDVMRALFRIY